MIELKPLTKKVAIMAAAWRNFNLQALRTETPSTKASQLRFWRNLGKSPHKYWGIYVNNKAVGMGGLTNITKRDAEISLILDPKSRGCGYGKAAVNLLLVGGLEDWGLDFIYGEVYRCNKALGFWKKVLKRYNVRWSTLPDRKYWNNRWWDSEYFSIGRTK
jgi:RimJ/RimL family protein N-acetyltransferase